MNRPYRAKNVGARHAVPLQGERDEATLFQYHSNMRQHALQRREIYQEQKAEKLSFFCRNCRAGKKFGLSCVQLLGKSHLY